MAAQVDLLGILFIIWGLLTTLVGVSTLALGVGLAALLASATGRGESGHFAASFTAAMFTLLAVLAILWGAAHIGAGVPLRRRHPRARILALVLGSVDLILLPYGTALGCYALYVLLSEKGKAVFLDAPRSSGP